MDMTNCGRAAVSRLDVGIAEFQFVKKNVHQLISWKRCVLEQKMSRKIDPLEDWAIPSLWRLTFQGQHCFGKVAMPPLARQAAHRQHASIGYGQINRFSYNDLPDASTRISARDSLSKGSVTTDPLEFTVDDEYAYSCVLMRLQLS
jgi:hypothetical protein